jgi:hypothetical protein
MYDRWIIKVSEVRRTNWKKKGWTKENCDIRGLPGKWGNKFIPGKYLMTTQWKYIRINICIWAISPRNHSIYRDISSSVWQDYSCNHRSSCPTPLTKGGPRGELCLKWRLVMSRNTHLEEPETNVILTALNRVWRVGTADFPSGYVCPCFPDNCRISQGPHENRVSRICKILTKDSVV